MENWWKHVEKEENEVSTPIKPQQVIPKLQKLLMMMRLYLLMSET